MKSNNILKNKLINETEEVQDLYTENSKTTKIENI